MKQSIIIDGGLGRIITAIPALEKFIDQSPENQIFINTWSPIVYGNKKIKHAVLEHRMPGMFKLVQNTLISRPEPYFENEYLSQKIHLIDAWNRCINNSTDALDIPKIYLSNNEKNSLWNVRTSRKLIAFQPFGSSAYHTNTDVIDNSNRSLTTKMCKALLRRFQQEGFDVLFISDKPVEWATETRFISGLFPGPRELAGAVYQCDYFLGIDSAGQHIARCFNKPGSVIVGSTSAINITYPDHFNVFDLAPESCYQGLRISDTDLFIDEIENADIMDIPLTQMHEIIDNILDHIKTTT